MLFFVGEKSIEFSIPWNRLQRVSRDMEAFLIKLICSVRKVSKVSFLAVVLPSVVLWSIVFFGATVEQSPSVAALGHQTGSLFQGFSPINADCN